MNDINSIKTLELITKANNLSLKKGYNEISLERAVFLSWWCDKGDCKFCYMSTQKNKIKDPTKAKRRVNNILAEAEMCSRLGWNIEFLSGGYKSFTTAEIKSIAENIHSELEEYGSEIKGITGAVEAANPEFQKTVCPSKPLDQIGDMLDKAGDLGFKKAITIILGLGESFEDIEYLKVYSLNPHPETEYVNSSQPASLYYAKVVSTIRLEFPDLEIICGTWTDNLANIGILILSGANGITKFPLFKMFGTKYGKRVEEEVKWTGRTLKGTFTDKSKLGPEKSEINPELDQYIKRYIKDSLKNKFK